MSRTPALRPRRRAAALALSILALVLLPGCLTIGGERTELKVYAPQIELAPSLAGATMAHTLAIAEPSASTALDTNRIAVRPKPAQLQVYAGAIWSDAAPVLLQSALVDALGASGRFTAVGRPTDALSADLLLRLDLRHFEAVYAEGADEPTVLIELQATLFDQRQQVVLASRRFRAEQPSEDEDLPEVVSAFESVMEATANAMAPWLVENAPKD